ncbi:hypothetical protein DOTSEDRAFT_72122 [Dothistroma septosporum NZE10]|uniref:Uncharacterized protein n=1 Tax=Dothistroma septosporum (strain NZE10 / CBS 128990) TaxID=675120 RepID=N1PM39_DOTSN|nr:hypothetical protein DOTSEDRAFT_72122 [Dothistroma septosporum NZE10]
MHLHHRHSDYTPMPSVTHTSSCNLSCASRGENAKYDIYPKQTLTAEQRIAVQQALREQAQEFEEKQHPVTGTVCWSTRLATEHATLLKQNPEFNSHVRSYNVACDCHKPQMRRSGSSRSSVNNMLELSLRPSAES